MTKRCLDSLKKQMIRVMGSLYCHCPQCLAATQYDQLINWMNKSSPKLLGFLSGKMKRVRLHFHLSILSKFIYQIMIADFEHCITLVHIGHIGRGVFFLACPVYHQGGKGWFLWMIVACYLGRVTNLLTLLWLIYGTSLHSASQCGAASSLYLLQTVQSV